MFNIFIVRYLYACINCLLYTVYGKFGVKGTQRSSILTFMSPRVFQAHLTTRPSINASRVAASGQPGGNLATHNFRKNEQDLLIYEYKYKSKQLNRLKKLKENM